MTLPVIPDSLDMEASEGWSHFPTYIPAVLVLGLSMDWGSSSCSFLSSVWLNMLLLQLPGPSSQPWVSLISRSPMAQLFTTTSQANVELFVDQEDPEERFDSLHL